MAEQTNQTPSVAAQPTSQEINKPTINDNTKVLSTKVETA